MKLSDQDARVLARCDDIWKTLSELGVPDGMTRRQTTGRLRSLLHRGLVDHRSATWNVLGVSEWAITPEGEEAFRQARSSIG